MRLHKRDRIILNRRAEVIIMMLLREEIQIQQRHHEVILLAHLEVLMAEADQCKAETVAEVVLLEAEDVNY